MMQTTMTLWALLVLGLGCAGKKHPAPAPSEPIAEEMTPPVAPPSTQVAEATTEPSTPPTTQVAIAEPTTVPSTPAPAADAAVPPPPAAPSADAPVPPPPAPGVVAPETAPAPATEPVTKAQATTAPTTQVAIETPTTQVAVEPTTEPTTQVALEPATEPTTQLATTEPTTEPTTQVATTEPATQPAVEATNEPANHALAERLTSMATAMVKGQNLTPAIWQYCEALLQAAVRLAPDEPRFARFLVEAATRAGDADTAISALNAYRKLRPDDEFAQVEQIEFYLGRMERSEDKLEYLQRIIDADSVPSTVRSAAAVHAAQVYAERMEDTQAHEILLKALQLNPLNSEAMRIEMTTRPPKDPIEQLADMLQMLRANPAQPALTIAVAQELANAGLVQRSLEWYNQAFDLHRRMGLAPQSSVGADYAAELFLSGDVKAAASVCDQLVKSNPDDLNGWLLKLVVTKASGDKNEFAKTIKLATIALGNRVAMIRKSAGDTTATTRPVDETVVDVSLPDPVATAQQLASHPELKQQFAQVAGAVAWLKIYFDEKPGQAVPWVKAMSTELPENDDVLLRLQGWSFLVAGNKDDARKKLEAAADRDAVAALGLIRLDEQSPKSNDLAKKLMADNPSGLTGAMLAQALASRGIKPVPGPRAAEMDKSLNAFPKDWMSIIDQPSRFYGLRLDPVPGGVGVSVGEPVLVQVTIQNVSPYPLTIGPDGVLHQDLWLDAQLRGVQQNVFAAEAYQRIGGPMLLMPGDTIVQVVRLDQRALAQVLDQFPTAAFQIGAMLITNPSSIGGQITIGPAGSRAQLSKLIMRNGAAVGQEQVRQKLALALQGGSADDKVRATEVLTKFAQMLSGEGANDAAKNLAMQAAEAVRRTTQDDDPTVHAWATYLFTALTSDKESAAAMMHDPYWLSRLLGVVAVDFVGMPRDTLKPMIQGDTDPVVRKLAGAAMAVPVRRAATQPTTQPVPPTSAPAGAAPAAAKS